MNIINQISNVMFYYLDGGLLLKLSPVSQTPSDKSLSKIPPSRSHETIDGMV